MGALPRTLERKRLMQSEARSTAAGERKPSRSVSWPRRTTSLSRASTASESGDAASTTTSLTELEPMSMAAIFISSGRIVRNSFLRA